jgi:protease I
MAKELSGKKIAMLATDGFEQAELTLPRRALTEAGATVHVIAPHGGTIQGMRHDEKGEAVKVDKPSSPRASRSAPSATAHGC